MEKEQKSKYIFIELLRILAAFLVIVNHTNSEIFLDRGPSITWIASLTYFFMSKMAVPIFVIISGYLMLNKCDDYNKHLKRVRRILLVILIFSLPYYVNAVGVSGFRLKEYLITILGSSVTNAYWYIYFYAGILVMMPFLQKFFCALEKKDFHVFFLMSAIFYMAWPLIVHYIPSLKISENFEISIFESYLCLLFVGGYFRKYGFPKIKTKVYVFVYIMCLIFNVIATYFEYRVNSGWYLFFDNRDFLPIVLQSICIFAIFSKIRMPEKLISVVKCIGGCTFGIYLLSDLLIDKLRFLYDKLCESGLYSLVAVVIFEIIIFGVGFVITYAMKKIPFIKNVV